MFHFGEENSILITVMKSGRYLSIVVKKPDYIVYSGRFCTIYIPLASCCQKWVCWGCEKCCRMITSIDTPVCHFIPSHQHVSCMEGQKWLLYFGVGGEVFSRWLHPESVTEISPTQVRASKPYRVPSLSYPPTATGFFKQAKPHGNSQPWYINCTCWFYEIFA